MTFKPGDVVRLKSGGQLMTVMGNSPEPVFTKKDVVCDWHNINGDGWHAYYHEDQLELVEKQPVVVTEKALTEDQVKNLKKDWDRYGSKGQLKPFYGVDGCGVEGIEVAKPDTFER